jgi:hypothetical protein
MCFASVIFVLVLRQVSAKDLVAFGMQSLSRPLERNKAATINPSHSMCLIISSMSKLDNDKVSCVCKAGLGLFVLLICELESWVVQFRGC